MKLPGLPQWHQVWAAAGCQGESRPVYELLAQAYAEPQRHYHNFQHIAECLAALDTVRRLVPQPVAVEMAIWFHDAVYDPRAADNEERSAALAVQHLTDAGVSRETIQAVNQLVLATKHHETRDHDACILADVDLAILGQSDARFQEYEKQIRQEYAWVPLKLFAAKRAEILRKFLARERIYQTDFFHQRLERTARHNLAGSAQNLEALAE